MARGGTSGLGPRRPRNYPIEGEPDFATGTLEEWERYREALSTMPQDDEGVRVAITVADARIATLRRARDRGGRERR